MPNSTESADSNDKPQAPNMRWQFIDASNNSRTNLTQVKRHVMQEYMRQKKGDSQQGEDEEEDATVRRAKRGRPKLTRAAQRKSSKTATKGTNESSNIPSEPLPTAATHQAPLQLEQDVPADLRDLDQHWDKSFTTPPTLFSLPLRTQGACHFSFEDPLFRPHETVDVSDVALQIQSHLADFNSLASWSSAPTTPHDLIQSPRTIMSAARTDPFNSLPIELDLDGQRLFDFYVNDMPACSYGTHFRSLKAHNWYTTVFVPEAMKGAVAFQNTILVHAANTWAWVRNEGESADGLFHRYRAIGMLREHLHKHPGDVSDVAIISCLSAAALEDFDPRPGRKEFSWMHMRAARDMIRARGGPAAFANTRLGMLINWQDYILSGYETHGLGFSFEPLTSSYASSPPAKPPVQSLQDPSSMLSPPDSPSSSSDITAQSVPLLTTNNITQPSPIDEIRLQTEDFLDFLRRCEQLALYQRDTPESCDLIRHTSVSGSSLLFQILDAPPGARFTASGDRKQMVARLSALMMLNAALWDYRYAPINAATFLSTLEHAIIDSEVSMSGSVEAILQILLACNDGYVEEWTDCADGTAQPALPGNLPDFTQYSSAVQSPYARPWFVGRMLKVAKRLSANSWHRVSDMLFSCLTLQVSESTIYSWEPELRREVLEAPLTSYIMPSLL